MSIVRPTEQFKIISILDEALDNVEPKRMSDYEQNRDISILELEKLPKQPEHIVTAYPLKAKFDSLGMHMSADDAKLIFASHVTDITGCDFKKTMNKQTGEALYDIEDVEKLVFEWVYEIAGVIRKRGQSSSTNPSSLQGTWSQSRLDRTRSRHVREEIINVLGKETAKPDPTK